MSTNKSTQKSTVKSTTLIVPPTLETSDEVVVETLNPDESVATTAIPTKYTAFIDTKDFNEVIIVSIDDIVAKKYLDCGIKSPGLWKIQKYETYSGTRYKTELLHWGKNLAELPKIDEI